jgi:hypothetical protein
MPELSRFFGIIIRMFYSDHEPAHFHAIYGEYEALIEIETLMVFRGSLPRAARSHWCWNGLRCTAPNYVKTGSGRAPEKR